MEQHRTDAFVSFFGFAPEENTTKEIRIIEEKIVRLKLGIVVTEIDQLKEEIKKKAELVAQETVLPTLLSLRDEMKRIQLLHHDAMQKYEECVKLTQEAGYQ